MKNRIEKEKGCLHLPLKGEAIIKGTKVAALSKAAAKLIYQCTT